MSHKMSWQRDREASRRIAGSLSLVTMHLSCANRCIASALLLVMVTSCAEGQTAHWKDTNKYGKKADPWEVCTSTLNLHPIPTEQKRSRGGSAGANTLWETVYMTDFVPEPGDSKIEEMYAWHRDNIIAPSHRSWQPEYVTICRLYELAKTISLQELVENWVEVTDTFTKYFVFSKQGFNHFKGHLVGEGVGAHIWSQVGNNLVNVLTTMYQIGRVTGLDPTAVCFDPASADKCNGKAFPQYIINNTAARYVDVLLTGREYWGFCKPDLGGDSGKSNMAHALYYANGGYMQPGCKKPDGKVLSKACSHWRAADIFFESVRTNKTFKAAGCRPKSVTICDRSYGEFGRKANSSTGIFGFATNPESPYWQPLSCWSEHVEEGNENSDEFTNCHVEEH